MSKKYVAAPEGGDFMDIVFDGPPGHESGRFVEVEDSHGKSIKVGEWIQRGDFWVLRIPRPTPPPATPAPATCPTCGVEVSYVEEGRCPNGHSMTAPATVAAAERVEEARVAVLVAALKWHRTYIPITDEKDARSELHDACDALLAAERAKGATS